MKKINKLIIFLLTLTILSVNAFAIIDTAVVNEKWGKPIYVYGSGLSDSEIQRTGDLLGIENMDNVNVKSVTGQDEIRYLGTGSGDDSAMISSVLVQKREPDSGVELKIATPENITQISKNQYVNAAITAGVSDSAIVVASVRPVTGESALTGIFKAYEENNEALDIERMQVAQKELETTNDIAQENTNKENFSIEKFNQVIIYVKQEINNYVVENDVEIDEAELQSIIEEAIAKYDLESVVTSDQVKRLVDLFNEYQETGAVDSQEVQEQLSSLASDVSNTLGEIYQDAKDSGLLDRIMSFIRDIINQIFSRSTNN